MNFKRIIQHLKTATSSAFSRISKKSTPAEGVEIEDYPVVTRSHDPGLATVHYLTTKVVNYDNTGYWEHQIRLEQPPRQRRVYTRPSVIFSRKVRFAQWGHHTAKAWFRYILLK